MRISGALNIVAEFLLGVVAFSSFNMSATLTAHAASSQSDATVIAHRSGSRSPGRYQLAEIESDYAATLRIAGTVFRVPCEYQPYIEDANGNRIKCEKSSLKPIPSIIFAITTASGRLLKADKYTSFPWIKSLRGTQIRVQKDEFAGREIDADLFLDFKRLRNLKSYEKRKIENTDFVEYFTSGGGLRYFVNNSPSAKTPSGYPLVFSCTYTTYADASLSVRCLTKYKWSTGVWISYRFVAKSISNKANETRIETWIDLDQLVRRFVSELQVDK